MTAATHQVLTAEDAVRIAELALVERFPTADAALAAGSIVRGEGTILSDVDLVVLYSELPHARTESFVLRNVPVEAFVHDEGTLAWFVDKAVKAGAPALLGMLAEGRVIGPRREAAERWKEQAANLLAQGPAPLDAARLDELRYTITDKVDDLRGHRTDSEKIAIATALYGPLAEILLRTRGSWSGKGKWLPRLLQQADAALADRFAGAFEAFFRERDQQPLLTLVEQELRPLGGLLFDGHRRPAPADARADPSARFNAPP